MSTWVKLFEGNSLASLKRATHDLERRICPRKFPRKSLFLSGRFLRWCSFSELTSLAFSRHSPKNLNRREKMSTWVKRIISVGNYLAGLKRATHDLERRICPRKGAKRRKRRMRLSSYPWFKKFPPQWISEHGATMSLEMWGIPLNIV